MGELLARPGPLAALDAVVDAPGDPEIRSRLWAKGIYRYHAIAMDRTAVRMDPARWQNGGRHFYTEIEMSEVRGAFALIEAGGELPADELVPINAEPRRVLLADLNLPAYRLERN